MKIVSLFFSLLLIVQLSYSQEKVEMLDSLFNTMHDRGQFSGNVLVVAEGEMIYNKSFGFADRTVKTPLNAGTLFNAGSVSQTFTAVAILQLNEKEKLDVDKKVKGYLPGFPYEQVTIGHLLSHASGLPELRVLMEGWEVSKIVTNEDVMGQLYEKKPELKFPPGTNSEFNKLGYIILAEVVEAVSKKDYNRYLKDNIFTPSGIIRASIYNADQINQVDNRAKGYLFNPFTQKFEEAINVPDFGNLYAMSGTQGDGNVWLSTGDLLNFCKALASASILDEESVLSMFLKKTEAKMPGQSGSYGRYFSYGWTIPDAPYRIAQSRGDIPGFDASIVWNLSENRMMISLSNDYLSFTSYNSVLPYAIGTIITRNTLNIPKKYASIELTNMVMHISREQIKEKLLEFKADPEVYDYDIAGLEYLVKRLKDRGETERASVIESLLYIE